MGYCAKCGNELTKEGLFCPKCGEKAYNSGGNSNSGLSQIPAETQGQIIEVGNQQYEYGSVGRPRNALKFVFLAGIGLLLLTAAVFAFAFSTDSEQRRLDELAAQEAERNRIAEEAREATEAEYRDKLDKLEQEKEEALKAQEEASKLESANAASSAETTNSANAAPNTKMALNGYMTIEEAEAEVLRIRERYQWITGNTKNFTTSKNGGITDYFHNGTLVMRIYESGVNGDARIREYYYETGLALMFAFIHERGESSIGHRFYYSNGKLMRYLNLDRVEQSPYDSYVNSLSGTALNEAYAYVSPAGANSNANANANANANSNANINVDVEAEVKKTRERYTWIQNNLSSFSVESSGNWKYYINNGITVKSVLNAAGSPFGYATEYFYDSDGNLIFVFITDTSKPPVENRFYFKNGYLIRWIDSNKNMRDVDSEDAGYYIQNL